MADSTGEAALKALKAELETQLAIYKAVDETQATLKRNEAMPTSVPAGGLVILRDGDPGDPDITMSPLRYEYDHAAEIEIIVGNGAAATRDAVFDSIKQAIAATLAEDRTLGGLVDDLRARAPAPLLIKTIEGATEIKAATIPVIMTYVTTDPLT